jgi:hypothetical protein
MNAKTLTFASILLAVVLGWLLFKTISDRHRAELELAEARSAIETIQAELNDLKGAQIADTDLARLKADQREAIKLRGEISTLKQSLIVAEKAAAAARKSNSASATSVPDSEPILKVDPLPEGNPEALVHKTKLISAQLNSGEGMVIGGWQGASGKRIFALIQPTRIDAAGNPINGDAAAQSGKVTDQIAVSAKWVELSEESAAKLGLGILDTSGEQSSTVHSIAFPRWLKKIEASEGVSIMSPPTVTTLSGRQARLSVTERRPTAGGPVEFGPKIDLLPTVTETGHIGIALQASVTESPK